LLKYSSYLQINTDEDKLDVVLADLRERRSHILDVTIRHNSRIVSALTPLQELMGFSTDLRSITSGTATCTMEVSHYEKMNAAEVQKVTEKITGFHSSSK
jgi:elongation factor G